MAGGAIRTGGLERSGQVSRWKVPLGPPPRLKPCRKFLPQRRKTPHTLRNTTVSATVMIILIPNQSIRSVNRAILPSPAVVSDLRPVTHRVRHAQYPVRHAIYRCAMPKTRFALQQSGCKRDFMHPAWGLSEIHDTRNGGCQIPCFLPSKSYKKDEPELQPTIKARLCTGVSYL